VLEGVFEVAGEVTPVARIQLQALQGGKNRHPLIRNNENGIKMTDWWFC